MMRRLLTATLTLLLLSAGGCTLVTAGADTRKIPIPGTPYRTVLTQWGNPNRADFAPDGSCSAVWMGSRTRGGAFFVGYILGLQMGHTRTAVRGLRMRFGPDGRLESADRVGYSGTGWRIWPFGN